MTGTITGLRVGGFRFIASDAYGRPWRLPFRCATVAGGGFDGLRVGLRVRIDDVPVPADPNCRHAVHVAPIV